MNSHPVMNVDIVTVSASSTLLVHLNHEKLLSSGIFLTELQSL